MTKLRPQRPQNLEGKSGSAGPSVKTEMQKVKKLLREKEKEVLKLKVEHTNQASQQTIAEEEHERRVKQLMSQLNQAHKKTTEMKAEMKKREEANEQLTKDLATATESQN